MAESIKQEYGPGDRANGYVLGEDNQWHLDSAAPPAAPTKQTSRGKWLGLAVAAFVGVLILFAATGGRDGVTQDTAEAPIASQSKAPEPNVLWKDKDSDGDGIPNGEDATMDDELTATVTPPPAPKLTIAQENALRAAKDYLRAAAFSRQGLLDQMTSAYGGQFPVEDATWAVDQLNPDWNAEAAEAAKDYLRAGAFSRQGLLDQMTSEYGGQFTLEQAIYGVTQAGY